MLKEDILIAIYKHGPLTSEEISSLLKSDLQTTRTIIGRLEKEELIKKISKKLRIERGRPEYLHSLTANSNNFVSRYLIKAFLEKQGFEVEYEKKLNRNMRIDVFGRKDNQNIGVEIKFNGVQWGFLSYKSYLNKLYLALPKNFINAKVLSRCKKEGIGLLSLDKKINEILDSEKMESVKEPIIKTKQKREINYLDILSSFFPTLKEKTSKEIEISTGLSHEPIFRILKSLVKDKYLKERKIGKTNIYEFRLTDYSYFVYTYFITQKINKFKHKHMLLYKRLKEFANSAKANSVILFGSYAKGIETKDSDIDILIISKEKNVDNIISIFRTKYNISIRPIIIMPDDFKNIKIDNKPFYEDLMEFGIILEGIEFFFKEVYQNA